MIRDDELDHFVTLSPWQRVKYMAINHPFSFIGTAFFIWFFVVLPVIDIIMIVRGWL